MPKADPVPVKKGATKPRGSRARAVKDPVEKTDRVMAGHGLGEAQLETKLTAQRQGVERANRLRELIVPKTEAMVKVMSDIALDPAVHPSIRMECADRLLSRAYGKPKEHVELSQADDGLGDQDMVMGLLNNILNAVGAEPLKLPGAEDPTTPLPGAEPA